MAWNERSTVDILVFFSIEEGIEKPTVKALRRRKLHFFSQNVLLRLLLSPFDANFILGYSAPGLSGVHESV